MSVNAPDQQPTQPEQILPSGTAPTRAAAGGHEGASIRNPLFPWYVWLVAAASAICGIVMHLRSSVPDDAASWWIAARLVANGHADALYAVDPNDYARAIGPEWQHEAMLIGSDTYIVHPYVHAPIVAYALAPLTRIMSFDVFTFLGALITGGCIALISAGAWAGWARRAMPPLLLVAFTVLLWLTPAAQSSVRLGQTTPFIFALIAMSFALSVRRPGVAAVLIAVAALIKLTPAVLIVAMLVFASRRRAGLIATAIVALTALASVVFIDSAVLRSWRDTMTWMSKHTFAPNNGSLDALLINWTHPGGVGSLPRDVITGVFENDSVAVMAIKLAYIAVVALGVVLLMGSDSPYKFHITGVTMVLGAAAVPGVVWGHYAMLAVLPVVGLVVAYRWWWAIGFIVLLLPVFVKGNGGFGWDFVTLLVLTVPSVLLVFRAALAQRPSPRRIWEGFRAEVRGA